MDQVIEMKVNCAFGGLAGLVVIAALAAACLAWGWRPTVQALSNFSDLRITALLAALCVVSAISGMLVLGPKELSHQIVRDWRIHDYVLALASNLFWMLILISATIAAFLRLEVFSGKGWAKRLAFGLGVYCASYLLASLVYVLLAPRIQE